MIAEGDSAGVRASGGVFLSLTVCLLVFVNSAEGFFHKKKAPGSVAEDYFKKLGEAGAFFRDLLAEKP